MVSRHIMKKKKTRNKFETSVQKQLRRAKSVFQYESEPIPYVLARHYYPDFIVDTPTGKLYIECKGYLRPEHKSKMVAVKQQHPEKDIRLVFCKSTSKKSNATRERWAIRNGFKYAWDVIPKEWLNGL